MKQFSLLLAPVFWSIKNDLVRFNRPFYRKLFFYILSSGFFVYLISKLINMGMVKLQSLPSQIFDVLMIKGFSLIFVMIFFIQIINGFIISLNTFYQSKELDVLFISPVNRTSVFFSRIFITHLKASWMLIIFGIPLLVSSGTIFNATGFYYIYSLIIFVVFSIIPVNIGAGLTFFFSAFFHSRKIKRFFFSTGIIAAVIVTTLFRIFKPETFVNPEFFANVTLFVSELKTSSFILLPNRWLSESLFSFLNKQYVDALIFTGILFLTAYLSIPVILAIFTRLHYKGWSKMQEGSLYGKRKDVSGHASISVMAKLITSIFEAMTYWINPVSRMLIKKDIKYQLRDIKNLHQILILLSLIIIYFFSIVSLPLNWENIYYATKLKYTISFLNIGLILIIITSLCSRIVYPAVVMEGQYIWFIKSAPISSKKYIWTKLLFFLIPVLIFGGLLTVFSAYFIGVNRTLFIINVLTAGFLSVSIVSLAMAFGFSDMNKVAKEIEKEQLRTGNAAYMIMAVILILSTLAFEAVPIYLYFLRELKQATFTTETWLIIWIAAMILLVVNFSVTTLSIRKSIKHYEKIESG